jgi:superfamily II DNA or RNA helicase
VQLRSYQQEALEAMLKAERNGIARQLVVLPTGSGKTVIFAHLPIARSQSLPMLVLAHRAELLQQAKAKIEMMNPSLSVAIEKAESKAGKVDVVIASVQTLGRGNSNRIEGFNDNYFRTIIVDEAHHASTSSYQKILKYFKPDYLLGVTATPQRSDSVRLVDTFDEIVYYKSIEDLIDEGWLCSLIGYRVKTNTDISGVEIANGDYRQEQLAEVIDNPSRNTCVVNAFLDLAAAKKTVVFAANIAHARNLAASFTAQAGTKVRVVLGETPDEEREQILKDFKSGAVQVIVNVGVLTEGFDEPSIEAIILARPTRSTLLYTQIVGRGTRLSEGKSDCLIIDVADATKNKKPVSLPTLLGLPPDFDLEGQSFTEVAKEFDKLKEFCPGMATQVLTPEDIRNSYKEIDLFMPPPPNPAVIEYSKFIWAEIGPNRFQLNLSNLDSMQIYNDALGRWVSQIKQRSDNKYSYTTIGYASTLRTVFAKTDEWIRNNRPMTLNLIDADAVWRKDCPTDKQIKLLRRIGVPITSNLTKGMASQIISKYYEDNPKPAWLEKKISARRQY